MVAFAAPQPIQPTKVVVQHPPCNQANRYPNQVYLNGSDATDGGQLTPNHSRCFNFRHPDNSSADSPPIEPTVAPASWFPVLDQIKDWFSVKIC